jgi:DNA-binding transcriptional regulator PaaX
MDIDSQGRRWCSAAKKASEDWHDVRLVLLNLHHCTDNTQWHSSSYSVFCQNYGTHRTAARVSRCWNEEAIAEMKRTLDDRWVEFVRNVQVDFDDIKQFIASIFKRMIHEAKKIGTSPPHITPSHHS